MLLQLFISCSFAVVPAIANVQKIFILDRQTIGKRPPSLTILITCIVPLQPLLFSLLFLSSKFFPSLPIFHLLHPLSSLSASLFLLPQSSQFLSPVILDLSFHPFISSVDHLFSSASPLLLFSFTRSFLPPIPFLLTSMHCPFSHLFFLFSSSFLLLILLTTVHFLFSHLTLTFLHLSSFAHH